MEPRGPRRVPTGEKRPPGTSQPVPGSVRVPISLRVPVRFLAPFPTFTGNRVSRTTCPVYSCVTAVDSSPEPAPHPGGLRLPPRLSSGRVSPVSPYRLILLAAFALGVGRGRKRRFPRDTQQVLLQWFPKWDPGTPEGSLGGGWFQGVSCKVRIVESLQLYTIGGRSSL